MTKKRTLPFSVNEPVSESYFVTEKNKVLEFITMAKELSPKAIKEIVKELSAMQQMIEPKKQSDFSSFLLTAPTMSSSQWDEFKKQRELTNQWREA